MRGRRTISPTAAAVEYVPTDYFAPLELRKLFPREASLEVDVGCGDGAYLAALAERHPESNFLGIERLVGRVRSACQKIARRQLVNARVLLIEASYAITHMLPAHSVAAFHLLFPDPWPKRRHDRRRLVTADLVRALDQALQPRGLIKVATDDKSYFQQIEETFRREFLFAAETAESHPIVLSTFQQRFSARPTYRLVLRKVSGAR